MGRGPVRPWVTTLVLALLVLTVDYATGAEIEFPLLYVLPVYHSARHRRMPLAYALSALLPAVRVLFHLFWRAPMPTFPTAVNTLVSLSALALYAYLIARISSQAATLETRVAHLEGVLPICASCKRIRNDLGSYEPIEKYITEHSTAMFSHGICPECAEKVYPEYVRKNKSNDPKT